MLLLKKIWGVLFPTLSPSLRRDIHLVSFWWLELEGRKCMARSIGKTYDYVTAVRVCDVHVYDTLQLLLFIVHKLYTRNNWHRKPKRARN